MAPSPHSHKKKRYYLPKITRMVEKWQFEKRPLAGRTYWTAESEERVATDAEIASLIETATKVGVSYITLFSFHATLKWCEDGAFVSISGWAGVGPLTIKAIAQLLQHRPRCLAVHLSPLENKELDLSPLVPVMRGGELTLANTSVSASNCGPLEEMVRSGQLEKLSVDPRPDDDAVLDRMWNAAAFPTSKATFRYRRRTQATWGCATGAVELRRKRQKLAALYGAREGAGAWLSNRDGDGALGTRVMDFLVQGPAWTDDY